MLRSLGTTACLLGLLPAVLGVHAGWILCIHACGKVRIELGELAHAQDACATGHCAAPSARSVQPGCEAAQIGSHRPDLCRDEHAGPATGKSAGSAATPVSAGREPGHFHASCLEARDCATCDGKDVCVDVPLGVELMHNGGGVAPLPPLARLGWIGAVLTCALLPQALRVPGYALQNHGTPPRVLAERATVVLLI